MILLCHLFCQLGYYFSEFFSLAKFLNLLGYFRVDLKIDEALDGNHHLIRNQISLNWLGLGGSEVNNHNCKTNPAEDGQTGVPREVGDLNKDFISYESKIDVYI